MYPDGPGWKTLFEVFYLNSEWAIKLESAQIDIRMDKLNGATEPKAHDAPPGPTQKLVEQRFALVRQTVTFRLRREVCQILRRTRIFLEEGACFSDANEPSRDSPGWRKRIEAATKTKNDMISELESVFSNFERAQDANRKGVSSQPLDRSDRVDELKDWLPSSNSRDHCAHPSTAPITFRALSPTPPFLADSPPRSASHSRDVKFRSFRMYIAERFHSKHATSGSNTIKPRPTVHPGFRYECRSEDLGVAVLLCFLCSCSQRSTNLRSRFVLEQITDPPTRQTKLLNRARGPLSSSCFAQITRSYRRQVVVARITSSEWTELEELEDDINSGANVVCLSNS